MILFSRSLRSHLLLESRKKKERDREIGWLVGQTLPDHVRVTDVFFSMALVGDVGNQAAYTPL